MWSGEWEGALRQEGIPASGIESTPMIVARCRGSAWMFEKKRSWLAFRHDALRCIAASPWAALESAEAKAGPDYMPEVLA